MIDINEYPNDKIFKTFDEAKDSIVGEEDKISFFNPQTRRPLKNYNKYNNVMLYSENTRLGYHGLALLTKIDKGIVIAYEIFDQNGEMSFKELWENEPWGDF